MLIELDISNLAVIDHARIAFGPGLNALTGETGAGKSIVIDAVGLLMGGRADTMQTIAIKKWEINYLDTGHSGFMNGTISFGVTGGKLPYTATFHYPNRKTPDVTLACGS